MSSTQRLPLFSAQASFGFLKLEANDLACISIQCVCCLWASHSPAHRHDRCVCKIIFWAARRRSISCWATDGMRHVLGILPVETDKIMSLRILARSFILYEAYNNISHKQRANPGAAIHPSSMGLPPVRTPERGESRTTCLLYGLRVDPCGFWSLARPFHFRVSL